METVTIPKREEATLAMVAHLLAFAGYIVPFGNLIGPLVVWQIKKGQSPFVEEQAKESLNFQLTTTLLVLVCIPLCLVLIGIPLLLALVVFELVVVITAAIRANEGQSYRYPLCIRFIA